MMDRGTIKSRITSSPALIENLFDSVKNFFVHRLVINGLMADWVVTPHPDQLVVFKQKRRPNSIIEIIIKLHYDMNFNFVERLYHFNRCDLPDSRRCMRIGRQQ